MSAPGDSTSPYGLRRPTMTEAREAMHRVHGNTAPATWAHLLQTTGLTGTETGEDALQRLLTAMAALDPVSQLCAHALSIRLSSYTRLSAAHAMSRSRA